MGTWMAAMTEHDLDQMAAYFSDAPDAPPADTVTMSRADYEILRGLAELGFQRWEKYRLAVNMNDDATEAYRARCKALVGLD
jgi:hypothetical protein